MPADACEKAKRALSQSPTVASPIKSGRILHTNESNDLSKGLWIRILRPSASPANVHPRPSHHWRNARLKSQLACTPCIDLCEIRKKIINGSEIKEKSWISIEFYLRLIQLILPDLLVYIKCNVSGSSYRGEYETCLIRNLYIFKYYIMYIEMIII